MYQMLIPCRSLSSRASSPARRAPLTTSWRRSTTGEQGAHGDGAAKYSLHRMAIHVYAARESWKMIHCTIDWLKA